MPKFTTWQYVKDPLDKLKSVVDFWEKIIINNVSQIKHYFPEIEIIPVRNSRMKNSSLMKQCVVKTIDNPSGVLKILKEFTSKKILDDPVIFASAVCKKCHAARGSTVYISKKDLIVHTCKVCLENSQGSYMDFDYWLYHKPLALPRIVDYKIDLCITGSDHYLEGDFIVREKLFQMYGLSIKPPKTLYATSVHGYDGLIMGKSKGNARFVDFDKLLNFILENKDESKIIIPNTI